MLSSPWDDQLFSIKCLKLFVFVCLWHTQHCFEKEISWSIISSFCFFSSVQILNMAIMTTFQYEKYTFCCENVSAIKSSLDDDTVTLISNIWLGERKYRGSNFEESFCRQIAFQCSQTFMAWLKSHSILLFWMPEHLLYHVRLSDNDTDKTSTIEQWIYKIKYNYHAWLSVSMILSEIINYVQWT